MQSTFRDKQQRLINGVHGAHDVHDDDDGEVVGSILGLLEEDKFLEDRLQVDIRQVDNQLVDNQQEGIQLVGKCLVDIDSLEVELDLVRIQQVVDSSLEHHVEDKLEVEQHILVALLLLEQHSLEGKIIPQEP